MGMAADNGQTSLACGSVYGVFGDADENATINVKDVTTIQKYLAKLVKLSEKVIKLVDVDRNNFVNVKDATAIQKKLAKYPSDLPIGDVLYVTTPVTSAATEVSVTATFIEEITTVSQPALEESDKTEITTSASEYTSTASSCVTEAVETTISQNTVETTLATEPAESVTASSEAIPSSAAVEETSVAVTTQADSEAVSEPDTTLAETQATTQPLTQADTTSPQPQPETEPFEDIPEGLEYEVNVEEGFVEITNYTGSASALKIPSVIEGLPVKSIGNYALSSCYDLLSVVIPDSIETIGNRAFYDCTSLKNIRIPANVTEIGTAAFANCKAVQIIKVDPENSVYDSRENCNAIIESRTNILVAGCVSTVIPNNVTAIGDYAFSGCDTLLYITIPAMVTSIGSYAFEECTALTAIMLPESVKSIGSFAFAYCTGVESIYIPKSVTDIGIGILEYDNYINEIVVDPENPVYDSRENCNAIISTDSDILIQGCNTTKIPYDVKGIGIFAFSHFYRIQNVVIPTGVTIINVGAFNHCEVLESITIPDSVTNICIAAFDNCPKLKNVYFDGYQTQWDEIAIEEDNDCLLNATIHFVKIPEEPETYPRSEHPYGYDEDKTWRIRREGAESIAVTFSDDTYVEEDFDFIYIYDESGNQVGKYSGAELSGMTIDILGDSATIRLTSDASVSDFGFEVTDVSALYDYPQSEHPYQNNTDRTWIIKRSGAERIMVTFSDDTYVEDEYDFICIYDADNNLIGEYTGLALNGKTISADTDEIIIRLISDSGINDYGFKVTGVEAEYIYPQSFHNYAPNSDLYWEIKRSGAECIDVTFSEETYVEDGFDYISIYYSDGELFGEYTGSELAGKTISVGGDRVTIRLVSDTSFEEYGFKVTDIEPYYCYPQSYHPYASDTDKSWQVRRPGASCITLTFSEETYFEGGRDYLTIYDENGDEVGSYTGNELAGASVTVPGDALTIRLRALGSAYGFAVTDIKTNDQISDTIRIYFEDTYNFGVPYCYLYDHTGAGYNAWPGIKMNYISDNVYYVEVKNNFYNVVFNDNDGLITSESVVPGDEYIYCNGTWIPYSEYIPENDGIITIYFDGGVYGWSQVYCYSWNGMGFIGSEWPGTKMEYIGEGIYKAEISDLAEYVVFNNGGNYQSDDVEIVGDGYIYSNGSWLEYPSFEPIEPDDIAKTTVYYDNNSTAWDNVYCIAWNSNGKNNAYWPGEIMEYVGDGVYKIELDSVYTDLIFNDGNSNQTENLMILGDGYIYSGGVWSQITEGTTVYFDNTTIGWEQVYCYTLDDYNFANAEWPGVLMKCVSDGIYKATIDTEATSVWFSNGEGFQTIELTPVGDGYIYSDNSWYKYTENNFAFSSGNTVYFEAPYSSEQIYCYAFDNSYSAQWPGIKMTRVGDCLYKAEVDKALTNLVFNDGSSALTDNLYVPGDGYVYGIQWRELDLTDYGTKTVYLTNNYHWDEVCVMWWGEDTLPYPGVEMSYAYTNEYDEDVFCAEIPVLGCDGIIFTDGKGNKSMEIDINSTDNNGFYLFAPEGAGDYGYGEYYY